MGQKKKKMHNQIIFGAAIVIFISSGIAFAYPRGSPRCDLEDPHHKHHKRQNGEPPYSVTIDREHGTGRAYVSIDYIGDSSVNSTLGSDGDYLKGILVTSTNIDGSWHVSSHLKKDYKVLNCNGVTH